MTQPATQAEPTSEPAKSEPETPAPSGPAATQQHEAWETSTGKGGKAAVLADLAAEREARKDLERQLSELSALKPIADLLGGKPTGDGKTDLELLTERVNGYETQLSEERTARWRAEVAAEKGLTAAQAARLQGASREEMASDADALLALFPTAPAKPGIPAPDRSQGNGGSVPDIDARISEAQKKGEWRTVLSLQNEKLAALAAKQ